MQQSGFRQSGFIRNSMGSITVMSSARQSVPSNDSELQLFRVLERANLLLYYESFIQNGGDDVQQLYDAYRQSTQQPQPNEENNMTEFIEIMKMVGMTKPLHVRRLQHALIQWSLNPADFQRPLIQREIQPNPQQMINLSLPQLLPQFNNPLNNNLSNTNSQSILHKLDVHNIVPPTSSIPTSNSLITNSASLPSLNSHSNSLPQLPLNSTINSSSIIPTTITSKFSQSINSLISPIQVNTNSLQNKSSSSSSSIVRPPISNLCKSPTSIKNESYNISNSNNLIQPIPLSVNLNSLNATGQNSNSTKSNLTNTNLNLMNTCIQQSNNNHQNDNIVEHLNSNSPICMTPILKDNEILEIKEKALRIIELYDKYGIEFFKKNTNNKKNDEKLNGKKIDEKLNGKKIDEKLKAKYLKDLQNVINMSECDPNRINEIRKFGSIYGRFDCKRDPTKPLSMHEIYVNEAAVQLCLIRIKLIKDRQTLFTLARRTVGLTNYKYVKGQSRSQYNITLNDITLNDINSESNSLPDNETNSIDIEREDSNDNLSISSDTSSSINKNELDLNNKQQSNYFSNIMIDQTINLMNTNQVNNNGTKSNNNLSKDVKFLKDQLENFDKQIELNELKIEDLTTKNTINESTEIKSKLIELKENQSLLIEQRNNLFKQICKLDNNIRNSPKDVNSDTEDDSQSSNCSQNSSKEISQILENNLIKSNLNEQHNRTTLKRKLLNSTTPQKTKLLKFNLLKDDEPDELINKKKDENTNGIDLRISHHFNQLNK